MLNDHKYRGSGSSGVIGTGTIGAGTSGGLAAIANGNSQTVKNTYQNTIVNFNDTAAHLSNATRLVGTS